jgi:hypothetical protein
MQKVFSTQRKGNLLELQVDVDDKMTPYASVSVIEVIKKVLLFFLILRVILLSFF